MIPSNQCQWKAIIILTFMVRGLFIHLRFPYAYYPTGRITADLLFPIAWEVVRKLECAELRLYLVLEIEHHKTEIFRYDAQVGLQL